jgi:hypothetical protein
MGRRLLWLVLLLVELTLAVLNLESGQWPALVVTSLLAVYAGVRFSLK